MAITKEQIIDETRNWAASDVSDLVDGILLARHGTRSDEIAEWNKLAHARSEELRTGVVEGVSGDRVSERISLIVRK